MKITISIKEGYSSVFLNFLKTLSYVKVEEQEEKKLDIPEQHKTLVRDRIKHTNPNDLLDWDKVQKKFKLD
jgi:hypothetical protein